MKLRKILCTTLALALCFVFAISIAGCGGQQSEQKDYYTVTYDLNYEGSTPKTTQVKANTRATKYQATRSGYTLDNWYISKECNAGETFDFASYINQDTTVYAKWIKNAEKVSVTFDLNYDGGEEIVVNVEKGETIKESLVPQCSRLGMQYTGWYKDANCSDEWNMATDVVNGAITLYAGYEQDASIPRDEEGNIAFENVEVNFFMANGLGTENALKGLVNKFNLANTGKIKIKMSNSLAGNEQADFALRYQQQPAINESIQNYYPVREVYDFAGIQYDASDWYEQASRDSYVNGKIYSVPIVGGVPYIVYNQDLMTKYNGTSGLPSSYDSFSTLLTAAYNGESGGNGNFKSIKTNNLWTFKECASYASFIQNDSEYYVLDDGRYVNLWGAEGDASHGKAVTALANLYNMFGVSGALHGAVSESDQYTDTEAITAVKNGNALMGLINIPASTAEVISAGTGVGVMPLSGLFATDTQQAMQIPIHAIGFQFYKADNVSLIELAAAAKFVDYVSKNSVDFAQAGWYPLRKSVVESDSFQNSTNNTVQILKQIGDPENFRTLDGYSNEKVIFNRTAAETVIVPLLSMEGITAEDIKSALSALQLSVQQLLI